MKSGAYGVGIGISHQKNIQMNSYRDPHTDRTIQVFNDIVRYVENLDLDEQELDQLKIGAIGER